VSGIIVVESRRFCVVLHLNCHCGGIALVESQLVIPPIFLSFYVIPPRVRLCDSTQILCLSGIIVVESRRFCVVLHLNCHCGEIALVESPRPFFKAQFLLPARTARVHFFKGGSGFCLLALAGRRQPIDSALPTIYCTWSLLVTALGAY
jgi:hypothetical protein